MQIILVHEYTDHQMYHYSLHQYTDHQMYHFSLHQYIDHQMHECIDEYTDHSCHHNARRPGVTKVTNPPAQ